MQLSTSFGSLAQLLLGLRPQAPATRDEAEIQTELAASVRGILTNLSLAFLVRDKDFGHHFQNLLPESGDLMNGHFGLIAMGFESRTGRKFTAETARIAFFCSDGAYEQGEDLYVTSEMLRSDQGQKFLGILREKYKLDGQALTKIVQRKAEEVLSKQAERMHELKKF